MRRALRPTSSVGSKCGDTWNALGKSSFLAQMAPQARRSHYC